MFLKAEEISKIDLTKPIVILDPGHRRTTPGKRGNGIEEWYFNHLMVESLTEKLKVSCNVFWSIYGEHKFPDTNEKDQLKNLGLRVAFQKKVSTEVTKMAKAKGVPVPKIIFFSQHANAATAVSASGKEIFIYKTGGESEKLAKAIEAEHIKTAGLGKTIKNRGIKEYPWMVCKNTTCPSVLMEEEFFTNKASAKKMLDPKFREVWATASTKGIKKYLGIA